MPTDEPRKGPETRDLSARLIGWVALGMALAAVAIHVGLWGLQAWLQAAAGKGAPVTGNPPIWVTEQQLKDRYFTLRAKELATYHWVDQRAGVVGLPIDRAMALVAERGIQWRTASPSPALRAASPTEGRGGDSLAAQQDRKPSPPLVGGGARQRGGGGPTP